MDSNLLNGLSDKALEEYLEKYKDNPAVFQQLSGIKEARSKNAEVAELQLQEEVKQTELTAEFTDYVLSLMADAPKRPSSVCNFLVRWQTTKTSQTVDGKTVESEVSGWAIDMNHACKASSPNTKTTTEKAAGKLEVTAFKLEADPNDPTKKVKRVLGKYPSMRAACNNNGVTATAASARQDAMHAGIYFE